MSQGFFSVPVIQEVYISLWNTKNTQSSKISHKPAFAVYGSRALIFSGIRPTSTCRTENPCGKLPICKTNVSDHNIWQLGKKYF